MEKPAGRRAFRAIDRRSAGETPALHLLAFFCSGCGLLLGGGGGGFGFRLGRFLLRGSLLRGLLRLLFSLEARYFFGGSLFAGGDGLLLRRLGRSGLLLLRQL